MNVKAPSFEDVEEMKRNWTEKYVQVDDARPELKRFAGRTGRVITVNMSGRALVQFDDADGWGWGRYDIALPFLRQVAAPVIPKAQKHAEAEKAKAAAPAAASDQKPAAKMSPIEMMRAKAAAKKSETEAPAAATDASKPAEKMSPIEMMRAKAAAKSAQPTEKPAEEKPAETKAGGKMSPLEMIRAKAAAKAAADSGGAAEQASKPAATQEAGDAGQPAGKLSPIEMIRAKAAAKKADQEKPE